MIRKYSKPHLRGNIAMTNKVGRPSGYTLKLAIEICEAISSSSTGLKTLCKQHEHWPCPDTIYTWLAKHNEFSDMYAQAKRAQVEVLIDEILVISDDTSNDTVTRNDGTPTTNYEHINRSRLRVDTRKWIACKLVPRVYGEKLNNSHMISTDMKNLSETLEDIRNCRLEYKMDR